MYFMSHSFYQHHEIRVTGNLDWLPPYINNNYQLNSTGHIMREQTNLRYSPFKGTFICLCLMKLSRTERGTRFANYAK